MDLSRYAELFLTESREHLSAINHALLQLERDSGGAEPISAIFRAVHTVKGMSATMGYAAVAELSHEMETVLDGVRRGDRAVDRAMMDTLFQAADALERAIELSVGGREGEIDVTTLVAGLRALAEAEASPSPRAKPRRRGTGKKKAGAKWTAEVPEGTGRLVRVRIAIDIPLRGVRAFIALQKAAALGEVTAVVPALDALQAGEFGDDFAFRLDAEASPDAIEAAIRAAGDVVEVEVASPEVAAAIPAPTVAAAAPAADAPVSVASEVAALRQQRHVRMDLRRLDNLMNLIGELVITRGRLAQIAGTIGDAALLETVAQASRLIADLQDEIMTSRMVPVWQVFDRFPRLVRDAARTLGKEVEFSIDGKDIELDRSMLDEIGDPIVHLLRNAIDHGIESPSARKTVGKRKAGRLSLSAARDRSAVLIRVSDDGRGVDRGRVLRRAIDMGLIDAAKTELSDDELLRLISRPGFSTAEKVTDISGRGVGIDAVQNRVRALGGSVEIRSTPGQGTVVSVRLPLTLAIVRALLARVGEETYAIPLTHVNETVNLDGKTLQSVKGKEVLVLRDDVLPLLRLRDVVHFNGNGVPAGQQVVVLELADRRAGLVVDQLSGQQEIVVKQFDAVREGLSLFSGVTILGDGAPALIVDVGSLL